MLDLNELQQFAAFAELGTLKRVAERFHISTPSVTRAMQQLEESFGVPLFVRGKNRIELNETGKMAAECAENLLREAESMTQRVRAFDQRQKTLVVRSCAPAPMWEVMRRIHGRCSDLAVSSAVCTNEAVTAAWEDGSCDVAVLPFPFADAKVFMRENLFVCVPPDHELAKHSSLRCAQINGFNFLLRSELGFWDTLCREEMPASKFLVQTDETAFAELVRHSSLPCFTTDYPHLRMDFGDRVTIPLSDAQAHATFYLAVRENAAARIVSDALREWTAETSKRF